MFSTPNNLREDPASANASYVRQTILGIGGEPDWLGQMGGAKTPANRQNAKR